MTKSLPINVMNLEVFNPVKLIKELDLQFFATAQNKVKFGLKNVHYAKATDSGTIITYAKPVPIPGGVSLSISPNGEIVEFPADDITYWSAEINNGYDGEIEIADVPQSFSIDILGEELIEGVMYESADAKGEKFALLFEINGDVKARRYVLYYCTATRPTIASQTKAGSTVEPQTSSLTFQSRPHPYNNLIKANTTTTVSETIFNGWYTSVHEKPTTVEGG
ncbi:major tail protein [Lysinibacillus sp. KU-BSD001]|uniref:major tail protein n=1 Tax=Lysinibacillus sp. KU-BSD001 TaxID=3141328 RepID=UPI0036EF97E5